MHNFQMIKAKIKLKIKVRFFQVKSNIWNIFILILFICPFLFRNICLAKQIVCYLLISSYLWSLIVAEST
jgi:hypothetical protein